MHCFQLGDGSTHPTDPWASNGGAGGAPLQPGPYGGYGGPQQQQPPQQHQQQVGPTPPLMTGSGGGGNGAPNPHMGQPSYPGQGIFSKNYYY